MMNVVGNVDESKVLILLKFGEKLQISTVDGIWEDEPKLWL